MIINLFAYGVINDVLYIQMSRELGHVLVVQTDMRTAAVEFLEKRCGCRTQDPV